MPNSEKWRNLLSNKRFGLNQSYTQQADNRSPFLIDADRIIFSSNFRRLQDKTQVHPLAQSSFVRTRLTHSLEVATVGRSLGYNVGLSLVKKYDLRAIITEHDLGYILQAACLAHDIGNPPFGHVGEEAIIDFFKNNMPDNLADLEKQDLLSFDGNSQGFRTLTNLAGWGTEGGLRLTFATLGAFCKYPRGAILENSTNSSLLTAIGATKSGIFLTELPFFKEVASTLDLITKDSILPLWYRHPLAFLTEAADDICYSIADIEDGFTTNSITLKDLENLLAPIARSPKKYEGDSKHRASSLRKEAFYKHLSIYKKVEWLRGKAISNLIAETISVFLEQEEAILNGDFDNELLNLTVFANEIKECKNQARALIFSSNSKLNTEITGISAIYGLLDEFYQILKNPKSPKSQRFSKILGFQNNPKKSSYEQFMIALDFISYTTDRQIIELYRHIKGF